MTVYIIEHDNIIETVWDKRDVAERVVEAYAMLTPNVKYHIIERKINDAFSPILERDKGNK